MNPVVRNTIALAVFLMVLPIAGRADQGRHPSQRRALQLPATGQWYEGQGFKRESTALDRSASLGNGYNIIYLADLEPGLDYTLGLRYPADAGHELSVDLFDRWPFDPKAKRFKLSMGPVVRTDPDWIEYRWRLSVSGRSLGNVAFISVEARPRGVGPANRFRHFMYLTTPAVRPMNQFGTGITYLRGPSDLLLPQTTNAVGYVIEYPYEQAGSRHNRQNERRSDGDLIFNGDFQKGLQGWEMFSEGEEPGAGSRVAVGDDGLRLRSEDPEARQGVRQAIQRYVRNAHSLRLTAGLRMDSGSSKRFRKKGEPAVVEISICYQDTEGAKHCDASAYRRTFTTDSTPLQAGEVIRAAEGERYLYEDELMDLDPRLDVVESISITGEGPRDSEAWIDAVHLIVR